MTLKQVFKSRVERASRVLTSSSIGPTQVRFSSSDLKDTELLARLHERFPRKMSGVFYLYRLSLVGNETGIATKARAAFRKARAKGTWNMSRDNTAHSDSLSLYVGASQDLHARFRTHLGCGDGAATWALYLSSWAVPLKAKFVVEYYEFRKTVSEDVDLIEGVLWDSLRPLFGKKGGK